jgi:hypothetical protein
MDDNSVCIVCCKIVKDEGVECDGECKRWFHPKCVDISTSEFKKISEGRTKVWRCNRVDCKAGAGPSTVPPYISDLELKFNIVIQKLDKLDKIDNLASGIDEIKAELSTMKMNLQALEPRVASNECCISSIKEELTDLKKLQEEFKAPSEENILEELNERRQRRRNVIVHGLPEEKTANIKEALRKDEENAISLMSRIGVNMVVGDFRCTRIGKPNRDKARPLRLIFQSEADAVKLLKAFAAFPKEDLGHISLTNDRTIKERAYLTELRNTIEKRRAQGETNLSIKYFNGTPKIISTNKKN